MTDLLCKAYDDLAAELVTSHDHRARDKRQYELHLGALSLRLGESQRRFRRAMWFIAAEGFVILILLAAMVLR